MTDHGFCPGSKLLRQPAPEMFPCPVCGDEVEIWTDELKGTCSGCGKAVYRDAAMSCLDWCKYGKECVGDAAYDNYMQNRAIGLKKQLLERLRGYFGDDNERIEHAEKVLHYAEELLEHEEGDWHIVIPAAILHDVGIRVAEEKYGSTAGRYQEKEGPPVARQILLQLGFNIGDIEQICVIIAHHHSPGELNSQNFKVLYDADCLVNLQELVGSKSEDELSQVIDEIFFTEIGKELARGTYLSQPEHSHSRR